MPLGATARSKKTPFPSFSTGRCARRITSLLPFSGVDPPLFLPQSTGFFLPLLPLCVCTPGRSVMASPFLPFVPFSLRFTKQTEKSFPLFLFMEGSPFLLFLILFFPLLKKENDLLISLFFFPRCMKAENSSFELELSSSPSQPAARLTLSFLLFLFPRRMVSEQKTIGVAIGPPPFGSPLSPPACGSNSVLPFLPFSFFLGVDHMWRREDGLTPPWDSNFPLSPLQSNLPFFSLPDGGFVESGGKTFLPLPLLPVGSNGEVACSDARPSPQQNQFFFLFPM